MMASGKTSVGCRKKDAQRSKKAQRGSIGSIMVAAAALSLTAVFYVSCVLISWYGTARHAQQGAELAALAAVSAAVQGQQPCPSAERAAAHNKVQISSCQVLESGASVVVEIEVREQLAPMAWVKPGAVRMSATAGN